MTSKGNEELAKRMQEAFANAGVKVGIDTISKVLSRDCDDCRGMGCMEGCDIGCLEACKEGNR